MSVRVDFRVAQDSGDAILKTLRDEVFQPLCLLVHLVPGVLQDIVKKEFEQSVMADEFPCAALSGCREPNAPVLLIHDESWPLRSEPLKHSGDRRSLDFESLGKGLCCDPQFLRAAQFEDRFEVIVDGFRSRRRGEFSWHYLRWYAQSMTARKLRQTMHRVDVAG